MITAALNGDLDVVTPETYRTHSVFGLLQPRQCPGVPTDVLSSRQTWNNDEAYYETAYKLSEAFRDNFKKYEEFANAEILAGAPNLKK
jgi:phosphoenolpyruvate carboxykinase (ATP)